MADAHEESRRRWTAPCRGARRLLTVVAVVTGLLVLALAADLVGRQAVHHRPAGAWIGAPSLSTPALWTAGSPMRHPEMIHPAVDLRFTVGTEALP